ncbi:WXG100-like domain-containing protein [Streptomyces sp. NPDC002308]
MVDAHNVPPELQNLLLITTGNRWPTGDETALRAEAAAWRETARSLEPLVERVGTVRSLAATALSGAGEAAVDAFLAQLVGGRGVEETDAVLHVLVGAAEAAAEALEEEALQIETLRIEIIGALVVLFLQLIIDSALWLFGGAAKATTDIIATRVLCLAFVRQAVAHMLTRLTESVVAMVGMALLAQIIELGEGHRHSLDGHELGVAAVNGAVGAPVGFGMGLMGGAATTGLKNLAKKPFFATLPNDAQALGKLGTVVGFNAGFGALTGMAEAAAQDSVYGLSGDWVAGAANGAYNAVWGARHNAQNPAGRFALSPAEHLEELIDHHLAGLSTNRAGAGTGTGVFDPPMPAEGNGPGGSLLGPGPGNSDPQPGESFLDLAPDTDEPHPPGESFLDLEPENSDPQPGESFLDLAPDTDEPHPPGESFLDLEPDSMSSHVYGVLRPSAPPRQPVSSDTGH